MCLQEFDTGKIFLGIGIVRIEFSACRSVLATMGVDWVALLFFLAILFLFNSYLRSDL